MTDNNRDFAALHALVDGELPENERVEVMAWIATDERAAQEYAILVRLKSVLRDVSPTPIEPEVWRRCVGRMTEIDRARRTEHFVGRYAWALCSFVFVVIVGGGLVSRMSGRHMGTRDVASLGAGLIPSFQTHHPSASAVPGWMSQALGQSPVNHFGRIEVVQAEAGVVRGVHMARLFLRDSAGSMVLFIIKDAGSVDGLNPMGADSEVQAGNVGNLNCVSWNKDGCAMVLTGSRDVNALAEIAATISFE